MNKNSMIYNSKPFQRHIKLKNQQFLWQSHKKPFFALQPYKSKTPTYHPTSFFEIYAAL